MACTPVSVSLEVNPSALRKIIFELDKICNNNNTVEWKLHFDLQERSDPNGTFTSLVKLDVDVNKDDHANAAATAEHGLDENQRAQAIVAGDTAKDFSQNLASEQDAKDDAGAVVSVRSPDSPSAN